MRSDVDVLVEVPCFKCLLWNPIMESHLHCNPNDCEVLTEWLLKTVEDDREGKHVIIASVTTAETVKKRAAGQR
jgi:hypothetical protein